MEDILLEVTSRDLTEHISRKLWSDRLEYMKEALLSSFFPPVFHPNPTQHDLLLRHRGSPWTRLTLKTHYSHEYPNNPPSELHAYIFFSSWCSSPLLSSAIGFIYPPTPPVPSCSLSSSAPASLRLLPTEGRCESESSVVAFRQNRLSEEWRQGWKLRFLSPRAAVQSPRRFLSAYFNVCCRHIGFFFVAGQPSFEVWLVVLIKESVFRSLIAKLTRWAGVLPGQTSFHCKPFLHSSSQTKKKSKFTWPSLPTSCTTWTPFVTILNDTSHPENPIQITVQMNSHVKSIFVIKQFVLFFQVKSALRHHRFYSWNKTEWLKYQTLSHLISRQ